MAKKIPENLSQDSRSPAEVPPRYLPNAIQTLLSARCVLFSRISKTVLQLFFQNIGLQYVLMFLSCYCVQA
jgi:hypothetical protein